MAEQLSAAGADTVILGLIALAMVAGIYLLISRIWLATKRSLYPINLVVTAIEESEEVDASEQWDLYPQVPDASAEPQGTGATERPLYEEVDTHIGGSERPYAKAQGCETGSGYFDMRYFT
jgi:hypothetical protein